MKTGMAKPIVDGDYIEVENYYGTGSSNGGSESQGEVVSEISVTSIIILNN